MKQVTPPPHRPPLHGISRSKPAPPSSPAQTGAGSCPSRNGELPLAVPADRYDTPAGRSVRHSPDILADLQAKIRAIERTGSAAMPPGRADPRDAATHDISIENGATAHAAAALATPWLLGAAEVDARLGPRGLDPHAIHEIKPGTAIADWGAALGFALRLAVRRLRAPDRGPHDRGPHDRGIAGRILWCATDRMTGEIGRPHGIGLLRLGIDPAALILVEARRPADVLWAIEDGARSRSLLLVLGLVDEVGSIPARRLSLATEAGATPLLLLTHPQRAATAATASRWRISARPSAMHPLDPRAPGATRFGFAIERCRNRPLETEARSHLLEWSDEAHRFHMAAGMADRAHAPPSSERRDAERRGDREPRSHAAG